MAPPSAFACACEHLETGDLKLHLRELFRMCTACILLCEASRQHKPLHALGILMGKVPKCELAVLIGLLNDLC